MIRKLDKTIDFKMEIDGKTVADLVARGTLDKNRLVFSDGQGQTYHLQFSPEEICLLRTGEEELVLLFRPETQSGGILRSGELEFEMNVYTRKIEIYPSKMVLEYDLLNGNEPAARHFMTAEWQ